MIAVAFWSILGLLAAISVVQFFKRRSSDAAQQRQLRCQTEYFEIKMAIRDCLNQNMMIGLDKEIDSLKQRYSDVPQVNAYYKRLCEEYLRREGELMAGGIKRN